MNINQNISNDDMILNHTNKIQNHIALLAKSESLTERQAQSAFQIIMNGGATPAQIAALLVGLTIKGETVEEMLGAVNVMRSKISDKIIAPEGAIDTCGTGGDGKNTLNISTAVAIVVAACGVPVAKHGNRAVSSSSGSADVLHELGVNIYASAKNAEKCLHEIGLCFLMAPRHHKAMQYVAPVRKELEIRSIFNLIGPLLNPASVEYQVIGVYSRDLVRKMAEVLRNLGVKKAWVVHGHDGMDELSIACPNDVAEISDNVIKQFTLDPAEYGFALDDESELHGRDCHYNADKMMGLLNGHPSAYHDIVVLNAAANLYVAGKVINIQDGINMATEAIDSGKAKDKLSELINISNQDDDE